MRLALKESKKAIPNCLPNPPVGCVLVEDDKIVSSGFTQIPGDNHAEIEALNNVAGSLKNITAYITLEPCSFKGRTPSCAQALIKRNISKVYVAIRDPDPRNNGAGIKMLQEDGIPVEEGLLSDTVLKFLKPYLLYT